MCVDSLGASTAALPTETLEPLFLSTYSTYKVHKVSKYALRLHVGCVNKLHVFSIHVFNALIFALQMTVEMLDYSINSFQGLICL